MKKIIAYILLFIVINFTTEIHEFYRLPSLINHIQEHQNKNANFSFFDFLEEHYSSTTKEDNSHNNLPFHNHHIILYLAYHIDNFYKFAFSLKNFELPFEVYNIQNQELNSNFIQTIFSPPKI